MIARFFISAFGETMRRKRQSAQKYGLLVGSTILLGACSSTSVQIDKIFPSPLIVPIPAHIGVHFSDNLINFTHDEEVEANGSWSIAVGSAQQSMFQQILSGMFIATTPVPGPDDFSSITTPLDAILVPEVIDFQFSIPAQTRTPFYEVWIKYEISLYQPTGEIIAQWPLTAYGKANTDNYSFLQRTREPAVQEATRIALRDAAAFFALRFGRESEIRNWITQLEES
jgi:hypothetical protein